MNKTTPLFNGVGANFLSPSTVWIKTTPFSSSFRLANRICRDTSVGY